MDQGVFWGSWTLRPEGGPRGTVSTAESGARARLDTRHRFAPQATAGRPRADEHPRRVHRKLFRCNERMWRAAMRRATPQECTDARIQHRHNYATPQRGDMQRRKNATLQECNAARIMQRRSDATSVRSALLLRRRTGAMPARVLSVGLAFSPVHIQ